MRRNRKIALIAVHVSLLLHIVLLGISQRYELEGMQDKLERSKRLFHVEILREKREPKPIRRAETVPMASGAEMKFEIPQVGPAEKPVASEDVFQPIAKKTMASIIPPMVAQPVVLERRDAFEYETTRNKDFSIVRPKQERATRKTLVDPAEISEDADKSVLDQMASLEDFSADFVDRMPGITPATAGTQEKALASAAGTGTFQGYQPLVGGGSSREDLKGLVQYALWTYVDPRDQQRYFKLSLKVGERADDFSTLPKEIVFLIDSSISIEQDRLEEFKAGLEYCLTHLNPDDVFNIKAFKEDIHFFSEKSVPPTTDNINKAKAFVNQLSAGAKTDAYSALAESIQNPYIREPSYILFLSDGRPTQGVTNPTRVISEISGLNNGRVAIFSFSGGLRVNRYLLDFLSYKNRGWAEYSYRTHQIDENLIGMYEKVRDPVMTNMRYKIAGMDEEEVFPKILPDFFRNAEFTLYGRYERDEKIAVRLLGDLETETKELFVDIDLSKAAEGEEDIVRYWAFNKIYHLIGLIQYGEDNTELIGTIQELGKYYNIRTPYLDNL